MAYDHHAGHGGYNLSVTTEPLANSSDQILMNHDHEHMAQGCHDMKEGSVNHMMSMSFHFGTEETVLFSFWKFTTVGGLVGSMIGIFILAVLYEGLKYYREYLFWRTYSLLQYKSVPIPVDKTPVPPENKVLQFSSKAGT